MNTAAEDTLTITVTELKAVIERVVREEAQKAVREEVQRALLEVWTQAGADDPAEDEILLRDALAQIEKYGDDHSSFITLEELKAELAAEAHALPSQNHAGSA